MTTTVYFVGITSYHRRIDLWVFGAIFHRLNDGDPGVRGIVLAMN